MSIWSFYKAFLQNPRTVGAISPSSKCLSRTVASCLPVDDNGLIVELGAGTGVVTQQMLQRGVDPKRLILIEQSRYLVDNLKRQFPNITTIQGNATQLTELLGKRHHEICAIVSSLPLLSLPRDIRERIITEIDKNLPPGGCYIQYTYWISASTFARKDRYVKKTSHYVWLNFPPARVDAFIVTK